MGIPNAYCKKHDEIEPEDNTELWVCPKCSRENMKKLSKRDENGKTALDRAIEEIDKKFGGKK